MKKIEVNQLRNALVEVTQNEVIIGLIQKYLSRNYRDSNLVDYEDKKIDNSEEIKERVNNHFYLTRQTDGFHLNESEIIGTHKSLSYLASKEKNRFVLREFEDYYGIGFDAEARYINEGTYKEEVSRTELNPELLLEGKFDKDLEKILLKQPQLDLDSMLKRDIISLFNPYRGK